MAGPLDLLAGSDDYPADEETAAETGDQMPAAFTGAGGLNALDIPGAAQALQALAKSSAEARSALQRARESIVARKYNRAIPLLAASAALGAPTRAGSTAESFANMSGALVAPLQEKQQFEIGNQKELLGIDTQMAGLDANAAQAQLQLAALQARLQNDLAKAPNDIVRGADGKWRFATRTNSRGQEAYTAPPAGTTVNIGAQKKLFDTLSEKFGEMYANQYQAALKAPQVVERVNQLRELLKTNPYTGAGAQWKLWVGKAAKAAGMNYAKDDIANTEVLFSNLGQATLDSIKTSGLGTGNGFTEKDKTFLQEVVGGRITLDSETLGRLSDIHESVARAAAKQWNDSYGRLRKVDSAALESLAVTPIEIPGVAAPSDDTAAPGTDSAQSDPAANPDDDRPARAPPGAEARLRSNPTPEMRKFFLDKYKYLPDGL